MSLLNKCRPQIIPRHLSKILKYFPSMTGCNTLWMKLKVDKIKNVNLQKKIIRGNRLMIIKERKPVCHNEAW